jgi:hypothetical protein
MAQTALQLFSSFVVGITFAATITLTHTYITRLQHKRAYLHLCV